MAQFKSLSLAYLLAIATAFAPSSINCPIAFVGNSEHPATRCRDVSLNVGADFINNILPTVIFAGALGFTVIKSEGQAEEDRIISKGVTSTPKSEEPVKEEVVAEVELEVEKEPEAGPEVEPKVEPKIEYEESPVVKKQVAQLEKVEVIEANDFGKDISKLKKQVASTLSGEQEKMNRLKKAAAEKEAAAKVSNESKPEPAEFKPETTKSEPEIQEKGKRRFVRRVVKKLVMPWRKWSSIK